MGSLLRKAQSDTDQKWSAHDVRRSFASGMGGLGIGREVIERVLSHAPIGMTARHYDQHQRDGAAAEAWQRWPDRVDVLEQKDVVPLCGERA